MKLRKNRLVVSQDESGYPVHIYNLRRCTMIGTVQTLSEGDVVKGFLEIGSGEIKNILKLKSFLEKKINLELEEVEMIKYSSLTQ